MSRFGIFKTSSDKENRELHQRVAELEQEVSAYQESNQALQQKIERLERIMQGTGDGWWEWPDFGNHEYWWSKEFYQLLGYEENEFQPTFKKFTEMLHPEDREATIRRMQFHIKQQKPFEAEYRLQTKSGDYRWLRVKVHIFRNEEGTPVRMAGSVRDITEQKEKERMTHLMNYCIENASVSIFWITPEGQFIHVNKKASDELGFSKEKLIGMGVHDVDPHHPKEARKKHWEQQKENGVLNFETEHKTQDGKSIIREVTGQYIDYNGEELEFAFAVDITARKRAEKALRESESQFRTLFETMAQGVVYQNAKGEIISANPAAERILGVSLEQMLRRTSEDSNWRTIHEDGSPFPVEEHPAMIALRTGQRVEDVVMGVYNPNEEQHRWIIVNAVPEYRPGETKPYRVYASFEDITELKRQERELRFQAMLLNQIQDLITSTDINGCITYVNGTACQALGKTRDELIGQYVQSFGENPERGATQQEIIDTTLAKGEWRGNIVNYSVDGKEMIFDCRVHIVRDDNDQPIGMVGTSTDVTELKKAEEALREGEYFLHTLLDAIPIPVFYKDTKGKYLGFNRAFENYFGKTSEEMIGKTVFDTHPPELAKVYYTKDNNLIENGGVQQYESQIRTVDGTFGDVIFNKAIFTDRQGTVIGLIGTILDITQRKIAELELERSRAELAVNNRIANIFLMSTDEDLYGDVLEVVLDTLQSEYGFFGYINAKGDFISPSLTRKVWSECEIPDKSIVFPRQKWGGLWGKSLLEKKTLYSNDSLTFPEGHIQLQSALCVPIVFLDQLIGQFTVANKAGGYSDEDARMLESIAAQTAPILNARLDREKHEQERKKLEEQLLQSQKMEAIGTLAGGVAHDFNNILMAILGNADLALHSLSTVSPAFDSIQEIITASRRAAELCNQMLAYSGKGQFVVKPLNLSEIVREMSHMLEVSISKKAVLRFNLGDTIPLTAR